MAARTGKYKTAAPGYKPAGKPQTAEASTATKRPGRPVKDKITKGLTETQGKIIRVAIQNPGLSTREIGALADCSHVNVINTLRVYGVDKGQMEEYKNHRADILAGLQGRLLASVTDEDVKKSPLGSRVLAACQLYDKERLERGESTVNLSQLVGKVEDMQRIRQGAQTVEK